jgi:hypothetical protein
VGALVEAEIAGLVGGVAEHVEVRDRSRAAGLIAEICPVADLEPVTVEVGIDARRTVGDHAAGLVASIERALAVGLGGGLVVGGRLRASSTPLLRPTTRHSHGLAGPLCRAVLGQVSLVLVQAMVSVERDGRRSRQPLADQLGRSGPGTVVAFDGFDPL